ncbi:hypothetical protein CPHLJ_5g4020 [Cryptosporidium parvum]|nr:Uncharacterized protein CPATCC_0025410 [Cryptosporidium parvum]WKS78013.1 hypothetical protein CPCDC_5g4020 [Cryptosporidium sp. 43IA8]WRK32503.1 Uncharacterized protein cpbgf_5004020 [Cryptosporidium parvum]|eukprot:QOY41791.1 hypothetical protein CPATCC_002390 [Cryptosporidium parvum]
MSNKERLEFLYDPKALLEYDNEKYLLGANIPENTSKILGETKFQNQENLEADFDLEEKEIINRLKEDPLLIIKQMELKHMKIVDDYKKKRDEFCQANLKLTTSEKNIKFRKSSLSRSPERPSEPYFSNNYKHQNDSRKKYNIHTHVNRRNKNNHHLSKSDREEKLQKMINYGKLTQNERIKKFNAKSNISNKEPAKHREYLHEMRNKINQKQISSLEERMKFMKN